MRLGPVQQSQLQLRHAFAHIGVVAALTHLPGHILTDGGDAGVVGMSLIGHQQIQLGVLLDLHTDLIQTPDGGVAGKEILGPGTKGDDFQTAQTDESPGDRHKLPDHFRHVLGRTHGVLGDKSLQMAHTQVVGAVEHSTVGVAPAINKVAVPLGGGGVHAGAAEVLGDECLRGLRAEVAQEHHQGVAACGLHIGHRFQHILLVLHGDGALVYLGALLPAGGRHSGAAALGQGDDEAISADSDDAQLYLGNIGQHSGFSFQIQYFICSC